MKTSVNIKGMHCGACVDRLTKAFLGVPGVRAAHVTLDPPRAEVETDGPVGFEALDRAARGAGDYSVSEDAAPMAARNDGEEKPSLYPLVLIVAYLLGAVFIAGWARGTWDLRGLMNDFMAGFFLVFSFFKLLDLRGFADAYRSYDVVARAWAPWGFMYPFVELGLGLAYLVRWQPLFTNAITLVLMLVGSVGVLRALLRKDQIPCACLGTALNLPMTTVTLVEDLAMAAMGAAMLLLPH
jgi:copper chaperone CopZ